MSSKDHHLYTGSIYVRLISDGIALAEPTRLLSVDHQRLDVSANRSAHSLPNKRSDLA
jgi:hypothetical protein